MEIGTANLVAILGMAIATYLTRAAGLFIAGRLVLAGRAKAAFEAIPPAVLVAVIAPSVLTQGPAQALAGVAAILAATRLPLLAVVAVGVGAVVALRAAGI